jgi:hypothetical protein
MCRQWIARISERRRANRKSPTSGLQQLDQRRPERTIELKFQPLVWLSMVGRLGRRQLQHVEFAPRTRFSRRAVFPCAVGLDGVEDRIRPGFLIEDFPRQVPGDEGRRVCAPVVSVLADIDRRLIPVPGHE